MAPSPSVELSPAEQQRLLRLARESIAFRLQHDRSYRPPGDWSGLPAESGACFVTLTIDGGLRGCVGTLQAREPLYRAVACYAGSAAVSDHRFEPLSLDELAQVRIEISVLSAETPLEVGSEQELLKRLRVGVDGLILDAGRHHATFLPQVWDKLPKPRDFVAQLRRKAGLPADHWDDSVRWSIYTVISFEEPEHDADAAPADR